MPGPLLAILAAAAVQMCAWALTTAPLQGPDEIGHAAYVQQLAETGHGPNTGPRGGPISSEQFQAQKWANLDPLVGVPDARPGWSAAEQAQFDAVARQLGGGARSDGTGPNAVATNPPLYYLYEAIPYWVTSGASFFTRLTAMRLASGLLYLSTLVFVWLLAGELFTGRRWLQVVATGVVAVQPKLTFMGSIVNTDILLTMLWTAFAYIAVRILRRGSSTGQLVWLAAVSAAAILTHGRGLAIVPTALIALLLLLVRERPPWRRGLAQAAIVVAGLLVGATLAIAWSSSTGGASSVGSQTGIAATRAVDVGQFLSYVWQFYLPRLSFMSPMLGPPFGYRQVFIDGFYGTFGSLEIGYPGALGDVLQYVTGAGLIGLLAAAVARRDAVRRHWHVVALLAGIVVSLLFVLHVAAYRSLEAKPSDPLLTGRYLLPLVGLFGVGVAFVVGSLPRRVGAVLAGLLLAGGVLLELAGLGLSVSRFYA